MSTVLDELSEDQREIVGLVRQFTDEQIIPVASKLERDDVFPDEIVAGLRELGSSASRSRSATAASAST